ncbi:hypothetical protein V2G26_010915 [Clonostachys chloroleuca]
MRVLSDVHDAIKSIQAQVQRKRLPPIPQANNKVQRRATVMKLLIDRLFTSFRDRKVTVPESYLKHIEGGLASPDVPHGAALPLHRV